MPGANGVSATVCGAVEIPLTCTFNCADGLEPSEAGTNRLICVLLLNRICAGAPSKVTLRLEPENWLPMIVASDPGANGPGANVAALRTLDTEEVEAAVVTVRVIGIWRVPAIGPASIVSVA